MSPKQSKDKATFHQEGHVVGLSNLGNTCFFNALLQCLHHSYHLHDSLQVLMTKEFQYQLQLDEMDDFVMDSITPSGPMTYALQSLLNSMAGNGSHTNPQLLFNEIIKRAPQFRSYQQQDSQEVMHYLLDGVRDEEVKRLKKMVVRTLKARLANDIKILLTDDDKKRIREFVQDTTIDRIFGGKVVNTITCQECHQTSQRFDTFLDLSLPIAEYKPPRKYTAKSPVKAEKKKEVSVEEKYGVENQSQLKKSNYQRKKERKMKRKNHKGKKNKKKTLYQNETPDTKEIVNSYENVNPAGVENKDNVNTADGNNEDNVKNDGDNDDVIIDEEICTEFKDTVVIHKRTHSNAKQEKSHTDDDINSIGDVKIEIDDRIQVENEFNIANDCRSKDSELESIHASGSVIMTVENIGNSTPTNMMTEEIDNDQESDNEDKTSDDISLDKSRDNLETSLDASQDNIETDSLCQDSDSGKESSDHIDHNRYICPDRLSKLTEVHDQYTIYKCLDRFCCVELMTGENKYHCKFCTRKQGKPIEDKSTGKSSTKEAQEEPFLDVFKQEVHNEDKKFAPVYTVSTAQMLICELPKVVVLNLKRFEHVGASFRKLAKHITFPLQLDMLPFCTDDCKVRGGSNSTGLYELFGVVVHIGRLGGGHYSAYVKARTSQSDLMSEVTESIEQDDLKESALHDVLQKLKECSMTFKQSDLRCQPGAWYHVSDLHVSKASENQVLKAQAYILFYKRLFVKG